MDEYLLQSSTPGEATIDAAPWRLDEEMGIICPLSFSFSMSYRAEVSNVLIANEIVHVFAGRFNRTPTPNPLEVSDWCWKTFTEVERDIDERPEIYTVWFRKIRHEFWSDVVGSLYGSIAEPKDRQPRHTAFLRP
jgi:isopentenyl-diphosphate delta-isomerase